LALADGIASALSLRLRDLFLHRLCAGRLRPLRQALSGEPRGPDSALLPTSLPGDGLRQKHGRPKVPIEDRIAGRIWQAIVDAGLATGELPPKREAEDAA
jgi:hypothetical protein